MRRVTDAPARSPWPRLLLAGGAGAIMALGAPPTDLWPLVWVGLGLFAWTLADVGPDAPPARGGRVRRALEGGLRGLLFGTVVNVMVLRFVPKVIVRFTPLPWAAGALALVLLAASEGLRWSAAGIAFARLARLGVPRWIAFAAAVWLGSFVPVIFPWNVAGGLSPWPELVQLADLVGERGVTALVAAAAGLGADAALLLVDATTRRRGAMLLASALGLPALMFAHGALRMRGVEAAARGAPRAKVALVQPSTEARERWEESRGPGIVAKLGDLTRRAEKNGAELVVWPEAAYPYPVSAASKTDLFGSFAILQPGVRGPVLTGLIMRAPDDSGSYNSAVVVENGRLSAPYHKVHLLWFGETVPFADLSPWVRRTFARGTGLLPGEGSVILPALGGRVRAAVLNCFEDTLPHAGREAFDGQRPNLLVNITNDAWFYETAESELHLRMGAMRAIELRRDLVRAVNRGPTTWVDASGRVRARYDLDVPGSVIAEPALLEWEPTVFCRAGELPMLALLSAACGALAWRHKKRRAPGPEDRAPDAEARSGEDA